MNNLLDNELNANYTLSKENHKYIDKKINLNLIPYSIL
jgi:ribosome assembly protein YihI (activator of Der GTPase)